MRTVKSLIAKIQLYCVLWSKALCKHCNIFGQWETKFRAWKLQICTFFNLKGKRPELCNLIKIITKFKLHLCIAVKNITQKFQNICPIETKEKALKWQIFFKSLNECQSVLFCDKKKTLFNKFQMKRGTCVVDWKLEKFFSKLELESC